MSNVRVLKKNEVLFREGEKSQSLFLIQSGLIALQLTRQKQSIELCLLGSNQVAGEHGLSGLLTHPHTAVAMSETKVVEISLDAVRAQLDAGAQVTKVLSKALADKLKLIMKDSTSMKLERDPTPCPPEQTAKVFGTLFHVAQTKGEVKAPGVTTVAFPLMKQYAQRVFLESPKRLENAVNIFVKLGVAKFEWVKPESDPTAAEEIGFVHFTDLPLIEQFFEFYQYYYFKGGKSEILRTDERVMNLAQLFLESAAGEQVDRSGSVRLDYTKLVEKYKTVTGLGLNNDLFSLMETKGLFVKRQSTDSGIVLQFELAEFTRMSKVWKVLREVEKWNEKGFVDPNESVIEVKKKSGPECPGCHKPFEGQPKFCSECGFKLVHSAAA